MIKTHNQGGKLSNENKVNIGDNIIKDIDKLISKIINKDIPSRSDLNNNHTLKSMDFFMGADICVIGNKKDIKSQDFGWKSYDYLLTAHPYEISWILCEIRDIYDKNNYYDAFIKYPLFGKFTYLYMKYSKKHRTFETVKGNDHKIESWFKWLDHTTTHRPWLLEKIILLDVFKDMFYSFDNVLPDEEFQNKDLLDKCYLTDSHIGAET